jgi:hypothetical protein
MKNNTPYRPQLSFIIGFIFACLLVGTGCFTTDPNPPSDVPEDTHISSETCVGDACQRSCVESGCDLGVCHTESGKCVACLEGTDCGNARCHPTSFSCVQCFRDEHCGEGVCTEQYFCVECAEDSQCEAGTCDIKSHTCVGNCSQDEDCNDGNPCTNDLCGDSECKHVKHSDGDPCEDGDQCTVGDSCLEGICEPGKKKSEECCTPITCSKLLEPHDSNGDGCTDSCLCADGTAVGPNEKCECPDPPVCPVGAKLTDTTLDGCEDSCLCADLTLVQEGDACPCPMEPFCPKGSKGVDTDKDGCNDTCLCDSEDCITCKSNKDCDDGNPCTKASCDFDICSVKKTTECCKQACDCYDKAPKPPNALCLAEGPDNDAASYWQCTDSFCVPTCGDAPPDVKACFCENIECPNDLNGVDTDGDTCTDLCVCTGGGLPNDQGNCSKCDNACDCYDAGLVFPEPCDTEAFWSCEKNLCAPQCGTIPKEAKLCMECPLLACFVGQVGKDTTNDGCPDTCFCPDATPGDVGQECACDQQAKCSVYSEPVDANQDGCTDWCKCKTGALITPGEACPCLYQISCVVGMTPVDTDADGCADTCVCEGPDCNSCDSDDQCDDSNDCTKDQCYKGHCLNTNSCCDPIDCPLGATKTDTDGDGCIDECVCLNGLAKEKTACACLMSIYCAPGYEAVDTSNDGCPDDCKLPCQEMCDCYLETPKACNDVSPGQGPSWTCAKDGYCQSECGTLTDAHYACLDCSKTNIFCTADMVGIDTNNDGCPDKCVCISDGKVPVNGQCVCPPSLCTITQVAVDLDGDGCKESCTDSCSSPCDCYGKAAPPEQACGDCPDCQNHWECKNGGCAAICSEKSPVPADCAVIQCTTSEQCPSIKQYCQQLDGDCKSTGICHAKPGACNAADNDQFVCGCDAKEYATSCLAAQAGVNVATKGKCK